MRLKDKAAGKRAERFPSPLPLGRSTQVWEVRIYDEGGKLISVSRCTLAVVPLEGV